MRAGPEVERIAGGVVGAGTVGLGVVADEVEPAGCIVSTILRLRADVGGDVWEQARRSKK